MAQCSRIRFTFSEPVCAPFPLYQVPNYALTALSVNGGRVSSQFTEAIREDGEVEVFGSTNQYLRFALERLDATYVPVNDAGIANPLLHDGLTQWLMVRHTASD
jgi:hypothetical protein